MTTTSELREMSSEQLSATLKETCKTLFRLQVQAQTERLEVPSELQRHRRLVARIKTIQNERKREAAAAAGKSETTA